MEQLWDLTEMDFPPASVMSYGIGAVLQNTVVTMRTVSFSSKLRVTHTNSNYCPE